MALETSDHHVKPWGYFPAEQYLLRHWNDSYDKQGQYHKLIQEFLEAGSIISESESDDSDESQQQVVPDDDQINNILKPWRSEKLRNIADALMHQRSDEVVILRTHYGQDPVEEEVMQKFMLDNENEDPNYEEEHVWWQFLNERAMFNFGIHWRKVYDILPELTLRGIGKKSLLTPGQFPEAISYEKDYGYDPHVSVHLRARLSAHPLAVVDEETFSTSRLKLHFIDTNGNIVRSTQIGISELAIYRMTSFRSAVGDWSIWQDAEVGERYQQDGDIGRVLHQKIEEARTA